MILQLFLKNLIAHKSIFYRIGAFVWVYIATKFGLWQDWEAWAITLLIVCGKHIYYAIVETVHQIRNPHAIRPGDCVPPYASTVLRDQLFPTAKKHPPFCTCEECRNGRSVEGEESAHQPGVPVPSTKDDDGVV